jgi:hypothetical protein
MKIVSIVFSSIGLLLMLYTLICGLWIHSQGASANDVAYHGRYAVASVIITLVGIGLLVY